MNPQISQHMPEPLRLLMVEDQAADAELIVRELHHAGFAPDWVRVDGEQEYAAHLNGEWDVILSDFEMPQFSGLRALELLGESGRDIPFIIVSGAIGEDTAVAAMKQGAADYLLKDRLARLGPAIKHALAEARLRRERKASEEALRESEERFRQLAENIQDVLWLTDLSQNRLLYISPAYEVIWGRPRAELYAPGRRWLDAIHPADRERMDEAVREKLASGAYNEEYRIIRPDGSVRWIRDCAFPVSNAAGVVDRVVGVARDITERKDTEEVLRESERRFRELLENVELIAMTLDTSGAITFCNDYLLRTTGWERAEVLGTDWFAKFSPGDAALKSLFCKSIAAGTMPSHLENPIATRAGEWRDVVWNNTVLRDGAGKIVGTASLGEDVTERNRSEARLRDQAAMLDQAHEAIIVRDIGTREITFWNQGAERLYGWTAQEALGEDFADLLYADQGAPDLVSPELLKAGEWRGERRHVSKAGKELIVGGHATLIRDEGGEPRSALVINIDLTERKALEEQLLRTQRLEGIGTLASGVAHDLNNILSPILMSVPLLQLALAGTPNESLVSIIGQSAERGASIVKQVLTFARGVEGERMIVQVHHLLRDMESIMRQTFPRSITIQNSARAGLWPVNGDATQLHQVLLNLCVNARDAMPKGGTLRIDAENLQIDENYAAMSPGTKPGPYLLITVSDTGQGIPEEIRQKIFDPFFTTKEIGKGTGLGLSTVIGIVKSHGGFLAIESKPGQGATFKIYLPAEPDAIEAFGAAARAASQGGRPAHPRGGRRAGHPLHCAGRAACARLPGGARRRWHRGGGRLRAAGRRNCRGGDRPRHALHGRRRAPARAAQDEARPPRDRLDRSRREYGPRRGGCARFSQQAVRRGDVVAYTARRAYRMKGLPPGPQG